MDGFNQDFAVQEKTQHLHLAALQQTRFAIIPIHTPNEWALFSLLMKEQQGQFSGRTQPNCVTVSRKWSQYCDGHTIFYKVCLLRHWSTHKKSL